MSEPRGGRRGRRGETRRRRRLPATSRGLPAHIRGRQDSHFRRPRRAADSLKQLPARVYMKRTSGRVAGARNTRDRTVGTMEVAIFISISSSPRRFIKKIVYAFHHSPSKSAAALIAPMSPHVHLILRHVRPRLDPQVFRRLARGALEERPATRKNASRGFRRSAGRRTDPRTSPRASAFARIRQTSTGPVSEGPATSQERVVFWWWAPENKRHSPRGGVLLASSSIAFRALASGESNPPRGLDRNDGRLRASTSYAFSGKSETT